jgi:cytochrome oxidase assembly protein ShyY1
MQSKEEVSTFRNAPLAAWLAMVALVLIVISVALLLAAWRAQKKQTKAIVAAQIAAFFHRGMQKPLVPSMNSAPVRLGGRRTPEVQGWSA